MSYLNLKTNKIYNYINSNKELNDCIEVDEMIAPIIQLLNEKGYRTTYCCSGHLFSDIFSNTVLEKDLVVDHFKDDCILSIEEIITNLKRKERLYNIVCEADVNRNLYISFEYDEGKYLYDNLTLPAGFKWDDINMPYTPKTKYCIRYYYKENEFFAFKKEQLDIIRRLYNWVKDLPMKRS